MAVLGSTSIRRATDQGILSEQPKGFFQGDRPRMECSKRRTTAKVSTFGVTSILAPTSTSALRAASLAISTGDNILAVSSISRDTYCPTPTTIGVFGSIDCIFFYRGSMVPLIHLQKNWPRNALEISAVISHARCVVNQPTAAEAACSNSSS